MKQFQTLKCCKDTTKNSHVHFRETHSSFMRMFFCSERIQSRITVGSIVSSSLVPFLLEPIIFHSSLGFNDLEAFRRWQACCFVACLSIWVYQILVMIRSRSCMVGQHFTEVMLSSSRFMLSGHLMSICALTGGGDFDHCREVCQLSLP